jgi:hypothetical protein
MFSRRYGQIDFAPLFQLNRTRGWLTLPREVQAGV